MAQTPILTQETLKEKLQVSNFEPNAIIRGAQLTLVGAHRALQNPKLFTSVHYKQAAIAVAVGIAIRLAITIPIIGIKLLLWFLSFVVNFEHATWDEKVVGGLDFIQNYVLQVPLFLMTLMRYVTPTLDNIHRSKLRNEYHLNLRKYTTRDGSTNTKSTAEAMTMYLMRFGKKAGISLAIFALSYVPYIGRLILPAASFYTLNSVVGLGPAAIVFGTGLFLPRRYLVIFLQSYFASRSLMRELLEPYFSRVHFTREQKKRWFHEREGILFGFGVGFYIFQRIPLLGVLIYGIAEASTAYLITKVTDPPPTPEKSQGFAASQQEWKNKHEFLNLRLSDLDSSKDSPSKHSNTIRITMGLTEIRKVCEVSLETPADQQPNLSNRWHPDIPFAGSIKNGETVKIECVSSFKLRNNDSADDVKNIDLTKIHYLSGPFEIESAEPGDVLLVEIMDVQPMEKSPWGLPGVFDKKNGGGFLDEIYPTAAKAIWDFEGIYCSSRHIPHVKFPGLIHPGILGCAPSAEVLAIWNKREGELIAANKLDRIVAQPPNPQNVHAGSSDDTIKEKVGKEGARTIPGRPENGGNCDIKNLSRGSKVYLPVHVKGAKFSVGDLHFSQGDGEISFCGAIEMAGVITINFKVMKNGVADLGMKSPLYLPGPVEPHYGPGRYLTFEGFSVDQHGKQHYMDVTVAYRQTTLRCIEYLRRFGYSDYQVYLLLSCAPVQGHVAGIVDIPNACTTLGLPMDIFDFDISPTGPAKKMDMGSCAFETGITEGKVDLESGKNSEISWGGGLTFKE
ncbi:formamidase [Amylocarpus encephaloides]|uniref:Formamidase n=1 Tax=Amylocarpus encephaloides TaxID=45428 RepID=A0A9P7YAR9_9HELO|nr:formamidase [Amylocarpus encephaloides]